MDNHRLLKLREYLLANMGLNFTENRNKELYTKIGEVSKDFGFTDVDEFIDWIVCRKIDNKNIERLASFLTIGETYFQRERKALDFLEYEYLPQLINKRKKTHRYIKIWSAGCSSGEEPYSVAIMLKRLIPNIKEWEITIKATDINPNFLEKAKRGEYTEWSFRGIDEDFKRRYFKKNKKGLFKINSDIKEMVDFSFLNLISYDDNSEKNNFSSYDIILCRNVMIYFSADGIRCVTSKFYDTLAKGGVLILSPVESTPLICDKFNRKQYNTVTVYSKTDVDKDSLTYLKFNDRVSNSLFYSKNKLEFNKQPTNIGFSVKPDFCIKKDFKQQNKICADNNKNISFEYILEEYRSGKINDVEKKLKNASDNVSDLRKHLLLAKIYLDKKELKLAEEQCLNVINKDKINANAYYILGTIYYEDNRVEDAISALQKAVFLEPNNALCHYLLGNIYLTMGVNKESERSFRTVNRILSEMSNDDFLDTYDNITVQQLRETVLAYLK